MISEKRLRDPYYSIIKPRVSENLDDAKTYRKSYRGSHRGYVLENLDENLDDSKKPYIEVPSRLCFGEPR